MPVSRQFHEKAIEFYGSPRVSIFEESGVGVSLAFDIAYALWYRATMMHYGRNHTFAVKIEERLVRDCNFRIGVGEVCHAQEIQRMQRQVRELRYKGDNENAFRLLNETIRTPKEVASWYFDLLYFLDNYGKKKDRSLYRSMQDHTGGITLFAPDGEDLYLQFQTDVEAFEKEESEIDNLSQVDFILSVYRDIDDAYSQMIDRYFA